MAKAEFYTYVHRRADTNEVFYVGKGKGARCRATQNRGQHWNRVVAKHGIQIEIVAHFYKEEHAFDHECLLISEYRAAGVALVNRTDGGDGASGAKRSDETKRRMSAAGMGKHGGKRSEQARANMRSAAVGRRPMPPEAIAKTVAFHTGRKRSPETLAKMSAALRGKNVGRTFSEETRRKLSDALTGRTYSPETLAKMSASAKARKRAPLSPEHRANLGASIRKACAERNAKKKLATE